MENTEFTAAKEQTIVYIYESICKEYIYKTRDSQQFFEQIKDISGDSTEFFENYLKAFVAVAKNDGKNASDFFKAALEGTKKATSIAEDYFAGFIQQAFAFFMYIGDKETARKFWDFGVEKKILSVATDSFFENFNTKEQFWIQFAPKMFVDEAKATEKATENFRKTPENLFQAAIDGYDTEKVSELASSGAMNSTIQGVSPLYYAIQRKGSLTAGSEKFTEDLVAVRTDELFSKINIPETSTQIKNQQFFAIRHQMRQTYEKSGLGKIMFNAYFGSDDKISENCTKIDKIIDIFMTKTQNIDGFVRQIEGKTGTNVLLFAAEIGDTDTCRKLIQKGADTEKSLGQAEFGLRYADGSSVKTEIPNSFIYRLISFKNFETLKMYLEEFGGKAKKSMTSKTEKSNITPLVYLILNTIYASNSNEEFEANRKIVDSFIPLFVNAGSSLDQNTAFGTAKKLLGL